MSPDALTIFEIQRYDQNKPRFNGVYSRNNFPKKIKDGAYDEYADVGTHWLLYFVEEVKSFILIVLVFNMFLKKLQNLSGIKTSKQTYLEYNQTIQ